jgi:hypothetical protein
MNEITYPVAFRYEQTDDPDRAIYMLYPSRYRRIGYIMSNTTGIVTIQVDEEGALRHIDAETRITDHRHRITEAVFWSNIL